jgi:holliday junction DNA helicase RuvA
MSSSASNCLLRILRAFSCWSKSANLASRTLVLNYFQFQPASRTAPIYAYLYVNRGTYTTSERAVSRPPISYPHPALTSEEKAAILAAMIGQLRGRLADKRPNQVMVDVGGVGYLVAVPFSTFAALGELHTEVTLLIHTHVREDALALYGFLSSREKHFFELLLGASGVGPSLALKILSGMSVEELVPAIRTSDVARLTKIPGVGRKTAERMVVELKDKLEAVTVAEEKLPASKAGVEADVVSALTNLGYDGLTAENAVAEGKRSVGTASFEKLLKAALQELSAPKSRAANNA